MLKGLRNLTVETLSAVSPIVNSNGSQEFLKLATSQTESQKKVDKSP